MLAKVDTNNSEINPYAPPATNDAADAKVRLSADDRYRVVGKNLVCRVGCEQFPDVCWLTGSTVDLVGVHRSKVRYFSGAAYGCLLGIKLAMAFGAQWAIFRIDLPFDRPYTIAILLAGILAALVGLGGVYSHYFARSFIILVGESAVARRKRRLDRAVPFCLAGILLLAFVSVMTVEIVDTVLVMWAIAIVCVALVIGYLWLSPKKFNARVGKYDDESIIISGLTQEFLETLRNRDRSWMPVD